MSDKRLIFVSHASPDSELAISIGNEIKSVLGGERVEVFVSSDDDAIEAGSDWFGEVERALQKTDALIVVLTFNSINRRWVWFEIGYIWRKMGDDKHIYPLAVSNAQEIPHPLSIHEAKFLDSEGQIRNFFKSLCSQFGFGIPENANIQKLIEMTRNSSGYLASENLSELEIRDLLTKYLRSEFDPKKNLIRYSQLDNQLSLPKGSSAKYLKDVAVHTGFNVLGETDNMITLLRLAPAARVRKNPLY